MKVVHIVESFAGGVYDFLVDLTTHLSEYEHIIIHGRRKNTPENFQQDYSDNTKFICWKNSRREISLKKDILALKEVLKILKAIQPVDVIHLHSSKAGFIGRLAARILGIQDKVIYTSHGVSFLRKDISPLKRNLYIYLEKVASKFGGEVVACSKSEAKIFQEYGIPAKYIYNGIKCKQFPRKKSSRGESIITIGTIGRVTYPKNPRMFNKIAREFLHRKDVRFLWVGDGELAYQLDSPNITLTGWLSREEVENKLKEIDIYLSTSLWEGLPLSVLQAMCAAKPLVLSDCVGNIDLVSNNGFIFKTIEEAVSLLNRLVDDHYQREILGYNSWKFARNEFSLEKMIEEYKKLYATIAKR